MPCMPAWTSFKDLWIESSEHPQASVTYGEMYLKEVYEALRASPLWNKTALIITYDENGGLFDHVPPPGNVPNPDGINSTIAGTPATRSSRDLLGHLLIFS